MSFAKIVKAGDYLITRLKEGSTHSALAALTFAIGAKFNVGTYDSALMILGIVFSTLGFLIPDTGHDND